MRVGNMCHPVSTLVVVALLACSAALPASDEKREAETPPPTRKPIRYCHFQTPCAWRIYSYSDFAEISLTNKYCVCRSNQKCKLYERRTSEGYSEFRCMRG